ncbi:MAG: cell surface protein [Lachnospiraceae bacterium]|nr:cell surface protein [Lachnospiraceae bacterium]
MKRIIKYIIIAVFIMIMYFGRVHFFQMEGKLTKNEKFPVQAELWDEMIACYTNASQISLQVNGREIATSKIYMQKDREIFVPAEILGDALGCGVHLYNNSKLVLERYQTTVEFMKDLTSYYIDGQEVKMLLPMVQIGNEFYLPLKEAASALGYQFQWNMQENKVVLLNDTAKDQSIPYRYDLRQRERAPEVKNQGSFDTCWAVAALTAVESSLMPEETYVLSPDHLNHKNSFSNLNSGGGEYAMAVAYFTAWQGPVLEEQDAYGDDISPENLEAVKHVQEIRFPEAKNYSRIKEMIYKYGGVESSIYSAIATRSYYSGYYNKDTHSYCYIGQEKPNHEVVLIGWDDSYPKENFTVEVEGDGAFICQNSWGESFGEDGCFYVSYYDSNIGIYNVAYTKVESNRNYDRIYQSDLCGWVGHLGYESERAFFANVYTTETEETVEAVGFYALGKDTKCKVYLVEEFQDKSSLYHRKLVGEGDFEDAGFYTVPLTKSQELPADRTFAVMVEIYTPGNNYPVAIEFPSNDSTKNVDITDGEGYISLTGNSWENVEQKQGCNLCLKVYTNKK